MSRIPTYDEWVAEKDFQAWLHKVDLILFETTNDTHNAKDIEVWRARWETGYLPATAIYEHLGA